MILLSFNNHKVSSDFYFISQGDISVGKVLFQPVEMSIIVHLVVTFFYVN